MDRICRLGGTNFSVTSDEIEFCESRGYSLPTLSPNERLRRRLSFRNQRHLYRRTCDVSGKTMVSMYSPAYPGRVVTQEYWRSDENDPLQHGREVDFSRPFFEQFRELLHRTPLAATWSVNSENCDYNCYCASSKNCYLCQSAADAENVYYTFGPTRSRDCMDCHNIDGCELCYEVICGRNCYDVRFSKNVVNCRESAFLLNCRGCHDCFLCTNLNNASYCFRNEQLSQSAYNQKIAELVELPRQAIEALVREYCELSASQHVPAVWGTMFENSTGNYLFQAKNVRQGFDVIESEDISNGFRVHGAKNCKDATYVYHGEELYEVMSGSRYSNSAFNAVAYEGCSFLEYCVNSVASRDAFGCVGLRRGAYCILNKQYSEDEYRALRSKLVAHMKKTGEWGEFFPSSLSPFAYNHSAAQDVFPLTKSKIEARGLRWEEEEHERPAGRSQTPPASIADTPDGVLGEVFQCRSCERAFKIQALELELARKLRVALAASCFFCRAEARLKRCESVELFARTCGGCGRAIEACYPPERPERVLCEECYRAG